MQRDCPRWAQRQAEMERSRQRNRWTQTGREMKRGREIKEQGVRQTGLKIEILLRERERKLQGPN